MTTTWPALFGLLPSADRETLQESLHAYPATLRNMAREPWRGKAVRVFVTFETVEAKAACVKALAVGTILSQVCTCSLWQWAVMAGGAAAVGMRRRARGHV